LQQPDSLLLAALRAAPRRYRMPPLPDGIAAALAAPPDTALAFAIEAARAGHERGVPLPAGTADLFTRKLAQLIDAALAAEGGDPSFQAMVLRASDAEVAAYARLAEQAPADRRALRAQVNALAHPGKLHGMAPGPLRDALLELHRLLQAESWPALAGAAGLLQLQPFARDAALQDALQAIATSEPLRRLQRADAAPAQHAGVRRYLALCALRGPQAGSRAAAAQGRASARTGELAERTTAEAFQALAGLLGAPAGQAHDTRDARYRALRGLRTPPAFPGEAGGAKDEWDAAIVREDGAQGAHLVLLAEVKAAPAAATPDFSRLHRGLERLALAVPGTGYTFATADGEVRLSGASLRALRPPGRALPPQVIYCCCAAPEAQPPMLSAASKAVLLAEAASLAFAREHLRGAAPDHRELAPVWDALATEPRLRSVLHQYATARAVREAMLHPEDLLAAATRLLAGGQPV
jgi:hypothetical protein